MKIQGNSKGIALLVVIMIIVTLAMAAAYSMSVGYNQQNVVNAAGGKRVVVENAAQAGMVDAMWRIRTGYRGTTTYTTAPLPPPGFPVPPLAMTFDFSTVPAYNPTYFMDLNVDGTVDVVVTIGPAVLNATTGVMQRAINAVGCGDARQGVCP